MKQFKCRLKNAVYEIKKQSPLIHHITNFVTIKDCANICTAIGASPVMAFCKEEVEQITQKSNALLLNLGTPDTDKISAAMLSGKKANEQKIPVVIDPVGIGASQFRKESISNILHCVHPSVIKGNVSEIKALAQNETAAQKGVDSVEEFHFCVEQTAQKIALDRGCVVFVTGKTDYITDGKKSCKIQRGSEFMTAISGAGCMMGTILCCFMAVEKEPFFAAVESAVFMNIAAEQAEKALGPTEGAGMFKVRLFDAVSNAYGYHFEDMGGITFD